MNLRIIYNDKISSFEKDAFVSIHIRNLQVLVSDMFKINRNISSSIRNGIFESRAEHTYNLRCFSIFCTISKYSIWWYREYILLSANNLEPSIRNFSKEKFKTLIKKEKSKSHSCRLRKVCMKILEFL